MVRKTLIVTLLLSALLFAARDFEGGDPDYFFATDLSLPLDWPITVSLWFNADSAAVADTLFYMGDDDTTDGFVRLLVRGDDVDQIQVDRRNNLAFSTDSSTTFSAGTWHHAMFVVGGDSSCRVWLDGGGSVHTSDTIDFNSTIDSFALGGALDSTPGTYFDGLLSYVAVWDANESASVAALAAGQDPNTIDPANLIAHWRLEESAGGTATAVDSQGTYTLPINGSQTYSDQRTLLRTTETHHYSVNQ